MSAPWATWLDNFVPLRTSNIGFDETWPDNCLDSWAERSDTFNALRKFKIDRGIQMFVMPKQQSVEIIKSSCPTISASMLTQKISTEKYISRSKYKMSVKSWTERPNVARAAFFLATCMSWSGCFLPTACGSMLLEVSHGLDKGYPRSLNTISQYMHRVNVLHV